MTLRRIPLAVLSALVVVLAGCGLAQEDPPRPTDPGTPVQERRPWVEGDTGTVVGQRRIAIECPNITPANQESQDSEARHDTTVAIPAAGVVQDIPEYHDCQRLVPTPQNGAYGPLVGIFAREALAREVIDAEDYQHPNGALVAQVYNFSSIPYGPLGIAPRYNCVYLRQTASEWQGKVVPMGERAICPDRHADWSGRVLHAVATVPSPNEADYPAVARWDHDGRNRTHYIGVKCVRAWCEIGRPPFTSSPTHTYPHPTGIKGWYDEQWLAHPQSSGPAYNARIRGQIVPVPGLDTLADRHFTCLYPCPRSRAWVHVATTYLDSASAHYATKLNFAAGQRGNRIYMRRLVQNTAYRWQARIISAKGDTAYRRVLRVHHGTLGGGLEIPGTARWHWREDDETAWNRCDLGCCETTSQRIDPDAW